MTCTNRCVVACADELNAHIGQRVSASAGIFQPKSAVGIRDCFSQLRLLVLACIEIYLIFTLLSFN